MPASVWVGKPCVMKVTAEILSSGAPAPGLDLRRRFLRLEHVCWDPKDGELCLIG